MVSHWGMSEKVGPVACHVTNEHPFLGRDVYEQREFSEHTAQLIDEEVTRILTEGAVKADELLRVNRGKLDTLAGELESREMLDESEVLTIIGPGAPRRSNDLPDQRESQLPAQAAQDPIG